MILGRVDGSRHKLLFQEHVKPIYDPIGFGDDRGYYPVHDPQYMQFNASLAFTPEEVRVTCQSMYECEFDYFLTGRREIAMWTLEVQSKLTEVKFKGSQRYMSCGALLTAPGSSSTPHSHLFIIEI